MKESEAKSKCLEIVESRKTVFCPLIRERCRTDCESFYNLEVYNWNYPEEYNLDKLHDSINSYGVRGGYCMASMLHTVSTE